MFKQRTIHFNLFFSYSLLILCIIIGFISAFYFYTAKALEKKASESLFQLSTYIASQIDTNLKEMNTISQKMLFSEPLMELIYSNIYDVNNIYEQRKFNQLIYSITGPQFPVFQINTIQHNGNFAGVGHKNSFSTLSTTGFNQVYWFVPVLKLDGKKFITIPHKDLLNPSDKIVISLCRAISSNFGSNADSVIEIQMDYDKFIETILKALNTPNSEKEHFKTVIIFNPDGELIYPINNAEISSSVQKTYWNEIKKSKSNLNNLTFKRNDTGKTEILAYTDASFSGWTIMVLEPADFLLKPVKDFRTKTIFAGLVVLLITLAISYFVSNRLTGPIKKIHRNIKNLSLEALPVNSPNRLNSGINELEGLNQSFADMCTRLKGSLEEIVTLRSHEIQAQRLALQSQMNPHFLYNTISVISIMAEEDGTPRVVKACEDLSNMLRYISSDSSVPVVMSQEIEHTISFLNLMKVRYADDLTFILDVPENMLSIKVPKLIIQPLVENCTKYAINADPPWKIEVSGTMYPDQWFVSVRDNGEGFDTTWLEFTRKRLKSIDLNNMPSLKLDGMGLINIFMRLKILYGEYAVFELYNHPDGGAVVNIGGSIQ